MKKNEFDQFKQSLNLNIAIDCHLRRITEKIKLLHQLRDVDSLHYVSDILCKSDNDIDMLINKKIIDDEK